MSELTDIAMEYRRLGLSVIASDRLKQSLVKWKSFQHSPAGTEQIVRMFNHPAAYGIAIITGTVSRNLEAIDIDSKYDLNTRLLERFLCKIEEDNPELIKGFVIARSTSGGFHLYYRCREIEPNQPLARRPITELERAIHPKEKVKVLIETRGQGGYIIVPPTPGYRFLQHDFTRIPEISAAERRSILTCASSFNQYQERQIERRLPKKRPAGMLSSLDDYNLRGDVIGLLQKHGWTVVDQNAKRTFLRRPGDTDKRSSGSFNHELNYFSVFSTSTEFTPKVGYRPYAVYATLECGGNYSDAAKKLAKEGFGQLNIKATANRTVARTK